MEPKVSIIIPTRNGGEPFKDVLRAISEGILKPHEIIILDQASTDGTLEVAIRHSARVVQIRPEEFGHGSTRNLGAKLATGEYLVYLNQDALPASRAWLLKLVEPFERKPRLAGVYGRQLAVQVHPCEHFSQQFTYPSTPKYHTGNELKDFSVFHIFFSDVNACVRRSIWEKFPLNEEIIMCEDQEWAIRVLQAGYDLYYQPEASVFHANHYTLSKIFRRSFDNGISHKILPKIPVLKSWNLGARFLWDELRYFIRLRKAYEIPYLFLWEFVRSLGFLFGKIHPIFPLHLKQKMSLYRMYWIKKHPSRHFSNP